MGALEIIKKIQSDKTIGELMELSLKEKKSHGMSVLANVVKNSFALQKCTPTSIAGAVIDIMAMGLSPLTNQAYIIPYGQNATVQIGVHGLTQLALRSGEIKHINTNVVKEGQYVGEDFVTGKHEFKSDKTSDKTIGYMSYIELNSGFSKTMFWTNEQMHQHFVKHSKNNYDAKNRVWKGDLMDVEQKGKITMLKQILNKYAPKTTYIEKALEVDGKVYDNHGNGSHAVDKGEIRDFANKDDIKAVLQMAGNAIKTHKKATTQPEATKLINNYAKEVGIDFNVSGGWYGITKDELKAISFKIEQELGIEVVVNGVRFANEEPEEEKDKIINLDD